MATRPYQGFPYSQPHVTDAPTIDAMTASRWNNLPRRLIRPDLNTNVVYVELPEEEGSQVSRPNDPPSPDKKNKGVDDLETRPVIYIEMPESSSSDVAGPATPDPEPEYVQETIFYDPFENRRIDQRKEMESPESESGSSCSRPVRPAPQRPPPPNSVNLSGASSSGYGSSSTTPAYPPSFSTENTIYGRPDDFSMSPIPASEFPEPPPAYSEFPTPTLQTPTPTLQTPTPERPTTTPEGPTTSSEPPRTIVITPGYPRPGEPSSPIGLPNPTRKVVNCQHCGQRVHTLVIWENGPITHVIALTLACLMLIPLVILVYWTKTCKYQNHYCPNCNKKIGYEFPMLCIKMTYTNEGTGDLMQ